jgi:hypothetical protein
VPEDDCSNLPVAGWVEREFWFEKSCLLCLCLYKEVKETTLFSLEFRVLLYRSKFLQHYNIKNLRIDVLWIPHGYPSTLACCNILLLIVL